MIHNSGKITINRGDYFKAPLFINAGTKDSPIRLKLKYTPDSKVYFSIMKPNQSFEDGVIRKIFKYPENINNYGDVIVELLPQETRILPSGIYYFQAKLVINNKYVNTITDRLEFQVI